MHFVRIGRDQQFQDFALAKGDTVLIEPSQPYRPESIVYYQLGDSSGFEIYRQLASPLLPHVIGAVTALVLR